MADIDPNEDELISKRFEEVCEIIEEALSRRGHSMEKIQNVRRARMEILLMIDEILQIDAETRTRDDIERAYRKYVDRVGSQLTEDAIQEMIVLFCKSFNVRI